MPEQLQFPFPSLDFSGRTTLYPHEVAERIGICVDQVYDLCDDGSLVGVNVGSAGAKRSLRIPVESWRRFVVARMTGPLRLDLLRHLPRATLRELVRELQDYLRTADAA